MAPTSDPNVIASTTSTTAEATPNPEYGASFEEQLLGFDWIRTQEGKITILIENNTEINC